MGVKSKTALATLLDKVNQIGTLDGAEVSSSAGNSQSIDEFGALIHIDPNLICNWKFHDRPDQELGDLTSFAEELKAMGQIHPCLIRPIHSTSQFQYEVIIGERRWRAAKIAGIKLKAIVTNCNDHDAALLQAMENSNRKDLSWYAKGMSYSSLVNQDIISQKDLQISLKLSQSSIRNLLSYSKINEKIKFAIGDMTNIAPATAYEICRLQEKGENYIDAIISIAEKLSSGKIGHTKMNELVDKTINSHKSNSAIPISTESGHHLFTWRQDSNGNTMITFPKDIRKILSIGRTRLENVIVKELQEQLNEIVN